MSEQSGVSPLRRLLAELTSAPPGTSLAAIAERTGVSLDEARAMVDFWAARGVLNADELVGCSSGSCASCRMHRPGDACAARTSPTLLMITSPRRS